MTGKTHKQAGIAAALGTSMLPAAKKLIQNVGTEEGLTLTLIFVISSVAGAYLSDIDNENSTISKMFPAVSKIITKNHKKVDGFRHRYFFHNLIFALPFFVLAAILYSKNLVAFSILAGIGIGILSHIVSDWIMSETHLIPFCKRGFSLFHLEGRPKAQALLDKVFRYLLYATNTFLILVRFQ